MAATRKLRYGDRVKLTERGARIFTEHFIPRANRVDWFARCGTVTRVGKLHVYILWDGRSSVDIQPHKLLELVPEESP